ncbi:MAG TPA: ankyrin repeat domain-containing protein [Pyrinomonadaceae bacterium]|nr:ankyrin repeat domain-containing protein [Pyrinomonadaceae bacterium]
MTLTASLFAASCGRSLDARLLQAAADGDTAKVNALLAEGANVNYRQGCRTPLLNAVIGNHADTVAALLKAGANEEARDCDGNTPALIAAQNGYTDVRDIFFTKAKPFRTPPPARADSKPAPAQDALNEQLFSLLDGVVAIDAGEKEDPAGVEAVKNLIIQGADLNARDHGDTPLIRAAGDGRIEAMKVLLEHGADVNARDDQGKTALMIASEASDPDMVRLLLSKGAAVNLKDNAGLTAWTCPKIIGGDDKRYTETRRLLKQAGAK